MMKVAVSLLIFLIHTPLQIINLACWGCLIIFFGLIKLALPIPPIQKLLANLMHTFLFGFGTVSVRMVRWFNDVDVQIDVHGELSKQNWYLIMANHLSWLDIILLIEFAAKRIPAPKFFLKKELIWMPFVGLGAWALEMPFMSRYSQAYLSKYPHKRGQDIETTKRYCHKFKTMPTTVINFVEGTRFTANKHKLKKSCYQHLLPPKAGGIAFTLATMGELFTNILDISLLYPENKRHPMYAMLSGQMKRIVIDVNIIPVPEKANSDYFSDKVYRQQFQEWLNECWAIKDARIARIMEH
ncbi:acyltransferase [Alteromonas ponticola]|uniref:Acyltransferase n=1 Tax=Alteromonas aquimaris TaxID=2998417 RepID=A0ABT3PA38_9ALTE|nr:acyltransferase [Alteromonas aquimaris]MCW8109637.1 acyltransferase [Alteromonas aquimaris]